MSMAALQRSKHNSCSNVHSCYVVAYGMQHKHHPVSNTTRPSSHTLPPMLLLIAPLALNRMLEREVPAKKHVRVYMRSLWHAMQGCARPGAHHTHDCCSCNNAPNILSALTCNNTYSDSHGTHAPNATAAAAMPASCTAAEHTGRATALAAVAGARSEPGPLEVGTVPSSAAVSGGMSTLSITCTTALPPIRSEVVITAPSTASSAAAEAGGACCCCWPCSATRRELLLSTAACGADAADGCDPAPLHAVSINNNWFRSETWLLS